LDVDEDNQEYLWEQMEEWDFFQKAENLGKLIIVTVSEFDIPELRNWQFQLILTEENARDFEIRSGVNNEPLVFPNPNEIIVAVYTEGWDFVTDFTVEKVQMILECTSCGFDYTYEEMKQLNNDEFERVCSECN
jgi:hypothetical protein